MLLLFFGLDMLCRQCGSQKSKIAPSQTARAQKRVVLFFTWSKKVPEPVRFTCPQVYRFTLSRAPRGFDTRSSGQDGRDGANLVEASHKSTIQKILGAKIFLVSQIMRALPLKRISVLYQKWSHRTIYRAKRSVCVTTRTSKRRDGQRSR
jgi:hypothetical protein